MDARGHLPVVRKVRILLDAWNTLSLDQQERIIGRHRDAAPGWAARTSSKRCPLTMTRSRATRMRALLIRETTTAWRSCAAATATTMAPTATPGRA